MKKISLILSVVLLCTLLSSCAGSGKSSNSEATKVVFWNLMFNTSSEADKTTDKEDLFIHRTIREFQDANPGIEIEILTPPMDNYHVMLKSACASKSGPDVVMNWTSGYLMDYADYMLPLDSYFTADEINQINGWEACRRDLKPDGEIVGVPLGYAPAMAFYYNKALYRQAGVDPERKPETWDDFLSLCADLKAGGVVPYVTGEKEGYNSAWVLSQLWGNYVGLQGFNDIRNGKKKFADDDGLKQAFSLYRQLYELGYTNPDALSLAQADGHSQFLAGAAAIEIGMGFTARDAVAALGEDAGWFPYPRVKGAPHENLYFGGFSGNALSVTSFSKVPEESVKFIKYLVSAPVMDQYVIEAQSDFSNNKNSGDPQIPDNPILMEIWDYMKTTDRQGLLGWDNVLQGDVAMTIYDYSGMIFVGEMSIDEAMAKFDESYAALSS